VSATVKICNDLLREAVALRASDVHLEPRREGLLPRFRVDGLLRPGELLSRELKAPIISRMKVMANLNIAENRLAQDGRFRATVGGRLFDFRVSTLPGIHGEKVVLRLLDHSSIVTDLTRLGFTEEARLAFEEMLHRSHGMILVTGPTGSGKTTTLYAGLAAARDETKNVVTVEDPVEYEMEGVMQTHVHVEIGNTFANRLRSILRQDPDVILVGEIRDSETADIAIRSALTGHLLLSTLHTNSAATAVTRLQDMGVAPFLIASSLSGVIAQRLVRLICANCKQPVPQDSPEYEMSLTELRLPSGTTLYHGAGCSECNGIGLRGRVALVELLNVDKRIRRAIMDKVDADTLHRMAVSNGMKTLWQDGLDKLRSGLTTAHELTRALLATEDITEDDLEAA
jgi:type II secretory ATPase GspE/PulE/Tfp pilus assembly ATPase PilB-like protein